MLCWRSLKRWTFATIADCKARVSYVETPDDVIEHVSIVVELGIDRHASLKDGIAKLDGIATREAKVDFPKRRVAHDTIRLDTKGTRAAADHGQEAGGDD